MASDVNEFLTLMLGTGEDDPTVIRALAIGYAESGARATVVGKPNSNGTIDYGFLQINSAHFTEPHFKQQGWNAQTMLQLGPNIDAARYLSGGWKNWKPWATFNDGTYTHFIAQATKDRANWKPTGTTPLDSAKSAAGAVTGGVSSAVNAVTGYLTPIVKTVGVGVLGVLLLLTGLWLLVQSTETGGNIADVAKLAAVV